jgi:hypothetical protein
MTRRITLATVFIFLSLVSLFLSAQTGTAGWKHVSKTSASTLIGSNSVCATCVYTAGGTPPTCILNGTCPARAPSILPFCVQRWAPNPPRPDGCVLTFGPDGCSVTTGGYCDCVWARQFWCGNSATGRCGFEELYECDTNPPHTWFNATCLGTETLITTQTPCKYNCN